MDSKLINKKALKKAQNDAIKSALAQAQAAADNGSSFVTISFDLPDFNYTIVRNELKEEGVYIVSGGAHMDKNYDGSYSFSLSCEIK